MEHHRVKRKVRVLIVDDEPYVIRGIPQSREAILSERDYYEVMAIVLRQGFNLLCHDGFKKALRGLTSLDEVIRPTAALEDGS